MNGKVKKAYELTNAKITFVSLVDRAANMRTFLMKKEKDGKASFATYGRIVKADADRHYVTGIVYEPMVEDTQGNFMTAEEITKAAYYFAKNGGKVDIQHSFEPFEGAAVVESWIAKADFEIDGEPVKEGTWLMTMEITDEEVWNSIEKGDITGFSMGGIGECSEEDVDLSNVNKDSGTETGQKKGLLKQIAEALGISVVEKGKVAEIYAESSKGTLFWNAFDALDSTLRWYDPLDAKYKYMSDDAKIREALQEFSDIVTDLLSSEEPLSKSIIPEKKPIRKAGKAMSSKNLETLRGIAESLGNFLKSFEPDDGNDSNDGNDGKDGDTDGEDIKKEGDQMTRQEVETIVSEAVEKAMAGAATTNTAVLESTGAGIEKADEITPETISEMVEKAVAKALPVAKQEETLEQVSGPATADQLADMIQKAVDTAVAPLLKAKGLPTNLGNSDTVEKSQEHYLHGIL